MRPRVDRESVEPNLKQWLLKFDNGREATSCATDGSQILSTEKARHRLAA